MPLAIGVEPISGYGARSLYLAALDELARRYERTTLREALEEYEPPHGLFVVARDDGALAGGAGVRMIGNPEEALGEVKRLWVRPDLRRRGVATRIMTALEGHARETGLTRLYLETGPRQPEAIALYRREGWVEVAAYPEGATRHPNSLLFAKPL